MFSQRELALNITEYKRLAGSQATIAEMLAMPGTEDIEVEFPRAEIHLREIDLT